MHCQMSPGGKLPLVKNYWCRERQIWKLIIEMMDHVTKQCKQCSGKGITIISECAMSTWHILSAQEKFVR